MTSKAKPKAPKKKVTHKKVEVTTPEEIENGNDLSATITNAEPDAPPMAQTITIEPEVIVPLLDPDRPDTYMGLVARAWEEARGSGDAHFGDAAPDFQRLLVDHAKDVIRTNAVLESDTNIAKFEQAFQRLKNKGE